MDCGYSKHAKAVGITAMMLLLLVIWLPAGAAASTVIDNVAYMNNGLAGFGWNNDIATAYGQLITAPTNEDHYLKSFTFYVRPTSQHVYTKGAVYAWTSSGIGACLHWDDLGGPWATRQDPNGYQAMKVDVNFANLVPGQHYLLALIPDYYGPGEGNNGDIGIVESATDSYPGGLVKFREGYSDWVSCPTHPGQYLDLAFNAEFDNHGPVPEPATMILLGSGLAGLAGLRRKMKK